MSTTSSARSSAAGRYEIGDVATLVTLSLRTARFYEQAGLLVAVGRSEDGLPLYDDDALDRFFLIKKMKPLGFTVEEMRSLLTLREGIGKPGLTAAHRAELHDRLRTWVSLAEEKLASLQEQVRLAEDFMIGLRDDAARSLRADGGHTTPAGEQPDARRGPARDAEDGPLLLDDSFLSFLTDPLRDGYLPRNADAGQPENHADEAGSTEGRDADGDQDGERPGTR
ncbi:MerR family transcriptional regulator [Frankia canadensis]|uniref:MerR family transcriptional regulator n=1 Tax=Frankia canadensis TaxID=1836972 RepID=UPI000C7B67F3|nr:MerR family transcriptional regulator [Frankia canadensis]